MPTDLRGSTVSHFWATKMVWETNMEGWISYYLVIEFIQFVSWRLLSSAPYANLKGLDDGDDATIGMKQLHECILLKPFAF